GHVDATCDSARQHVRRQRTERCQAPDRIDQSSRPRGRGEHGVAVERSVHGADRASQPVLRRHGKPPCLRLCKHCIGRDDGNRSVAGGPGPCPPAHPPPPTPPPPPPPPHTP